MKQVRWVYALSSILFGVAVALFFALAYPHHLHFQEQYQLFQFNKAYICEVLSLPGGLADMIGRFLTQFFLFAWVGASLIALVLVCVQILTYKVLRTTKQELVSYAISFIPSILCCCFLCDDSALMTVPVALLVVLGVVWCIKKISSVKIRQIVGLLSVPVVYILAGAFVILYSLILIISELQKERSLGAFVKASIMMLVALSLPAIWHIFVHYSLTRLYVGPHYYRTPDVFAMWAWASIGIVPLLILIPEKIKRWTPRNALAGFFMIWAVFMAGGGVQIYSLQSQTQENVMAYDFMSRNALWNRIIQKAQLTPPKNQVAVVALNLALSHRGMLTDHMFEYPQNGVFGLIPNFASDYVSPLVTSEALYRLGLINSAQRFVFEAQEAIPDFQKSARCYKRLAETNLINGEYEVARKYLLSLQNTLFYSSWATEILDLIRDDEAVKSHPEYGALRMMRNKTDYFFGGNELRQILIKLLESNPKNRMAFEYLEASCLLAKDVEKVANYFSYSEPLGYNAVPIDIQQAMLIHWSQTNTNMKSIPDFIQPAVVQEFNKFYTALQVNNGNPGPVQKMFGKTYWSYYYFH